MFPLRRKTRAINAKKVNSSVIAAELVCESTNKYVYLHPTPIQEEKSSGGGAYGCAVAFIGESPGKGHLLAATHTYMQHSAGMPHRTPLHHHTRKRL